MTASRLETTLRGRPPLRRCPVHGMSFRAWKDNALCPDCVRDREGRERPEPTHVPVPYNEFPPGFGEVA